MTHKEVKLMRKAKTILGAIIVIFSMLLGSAAHASSDTSALEQESAPKVVSPLQTGDYKYMCVAPTGNWTLQKGQPLTDCKSAMAIWVYLDGKRVDAYPINIDGTPQKLNLPSGACVVSTALSAGNVVAFVIWPPSGLAAWVTQGSLLAAGITVGANSCRA